MGGRGRMSMVGQMTLTTLWSRGAGLCREVVDVVGAYCNCSHSLRFSCEPMDGCVQSVGTMGECERYVKRERERGRESERGEGGRE